MELPGDSWILCGEHGAAGIGSKGAGNSDPASDPDSTPVLDPPFPAVLLTPEFRICMGSISIWFNQISIKRKGLGMA